MLAAAWNICHHIDVGRLLPLPSKRAAYMFAWDDSVQMIGKPCIVPFEFRAFFRGAIPRLRLCTRLHGTGQLPNMTANHFVWKNSLHSRSWRLSSFGLEVWLSNSLRKDCENRPFLDSSISHVGCLSASRCGRHGVALDELLEEDATRCRINSSLAALMKIGAYSISLLSSVRLSRHERLRHSKLKVARVARSCYFTCR